MRRSSYRGLIASLALAASLLAFPALAQTGGQQLPDSVIQQQIPSAFPSMDGNAAAQPAAAPQTSPQTTSGQTPSLGQQQNGGGQGKVQNGSTPLVSQSGTASPPEIGSLPSNDQQAQVLSQAQGESQAQQAPAPAEPTQRKLVPSTPMGSAAQSADNGQGGQAQGGQAQGSGQIDPDASGAVANPVEDAAAAADQAADSRDTSAAPPPSIMDEYAEASKNQTGDALPSAVNNVNMVKLSGEGFGNAASKNVSVPIDPTMGSGKTPAQMQEEIRSEAFDAAITGMFPLSPQQIETLLKRYDVTQRAVESPTFNNPKPEVSVQNISLDPGVAPPVIRTAVGNVTTLNILDITGAPWPVQDVTWAGDYEIVEPEEGGHIIRITPMSHFARGNIVIRMLTLKTPITLTLETDRDIVQYRVDARIPEYGPFATPSLMQGGKTLVAGDPELTAILDGTPPSGLSKMQVSGTDGRTTAYSSGSMTYVRTPLTLLSPAWQSSISSADGMNVYALGTAPVLLLSDTGQFVRATLSEKKDLLDE